MRALMHGKIVKREEFGWEFNGRSGITYFLYVREDGADEAMTLPQRVKVTVQQFAKYAEGQDVELPVLVFANTQERGGAIIGAKLSVQLDPEHKPDEAKAARPHAVNA